MDTLSCIKIKKDAASALAKYKKSFTIFLSFIDVFQTNLNRGDLMLLILFPPRILTENRIPEHGRKSARIRKKSGNFPSRQYLSGPTYTLHQLHNTNDLRLYLMRRRRHALIPRGPRSNLKTLVLVLFNRSLGTIK